MLILSQNGEHLVNFDRVAEVFIPQHERESGNVKIKADIGNDVIDLGTYSSVGRSKEILVHIYFEYMRYLKGDGDKILEFIPPKVYRMPEK